MSIVQKTLFSGEAKPILPLKWDKEFEYHDKIYYIPYKDPDYSDHEPLEPALVLGQSHVKLSLSPDLRYMSYCAFICNPIRGTVDTVFWDEVETGVMSLDMYNTLSRKNVNCGEYSTHISVSLLSALCVAFNKAGLSIKLLSQNAEVIENYVNEHIKYYHIDCGRLDYKFNYKETVSFLTGD